MGFFSVDFTNIFPCFPPCHLWTLLLPAVLSYISRSKVAGDTTEMGLLSCRSVCVLTSTLCFKNRMNDDQAILLRAAHRAGAGNPTRGTTLNFTDYNPTYSSNYGQQQDQETTYSNIHTSSARRALLLFSFVTLLLHFNVQPTENLFLIVKNILNFSCTLVLKFERANKNNFNRKNVFFFLPICWKHLKEYCWNSSIFKIFNISYFCIKYVKT